MDLIEIDRKTCTQCGICAAECPGFLISFQPQNYPQPLTLAESVCIRCGHCVAVCPTGNLTHRDIPVEKLPAFQESLRVSAEQCEQLLKGRRSVRAFKDQPVSREMVARLIKEASYAPTGHNNQEVEWLVIDSREELNRIEKIGIDWIRWVTKNQPQMAAILNMEEMLKRQEKYADVLLRNAPVLIVAHAPKDISLALIDSATALVYLDIASNSLGLGTCWAGLIYIMANSFLPVKNAISVPEGHATYGCIMLGYNKFKYPRIPLRKEPKISWR